MTVPGPRGGTPIASSELERLELDAARARYSGALITVNDVRTLSEEYLLQGRHPRDFLPVSSSFIPALEPYTGMTDTPENRAAVQAVIELVLRDENRFVTTGTVTGRTSSRDPNIATIPRR